MYQSLSTDIGDATDSGLSGDGVESGLAAEGNESGLSGDGGESGLGADAGLNGESVLNAESPPLAIASSARGFACVVSAVNARGEACVASAAELRPESSGESMLSADNGVSPVAIDANDAVESADTVDAALGDEITLVCEMSCSNDVDEARSIASV